MHSRSGWPPVFNAVFVCTSVMLLVITVQPQTAPLQSSFEFLASVAGQPPESIFADTRRSVKTKSPKPYVSIRILPADKLVAATVEEILSAAEPKTNSLANFGLADFSQSMVDQLGRFTDKADPKRELKFAPTQLNLKPESEIESSAEISCLVRTTDEANGKEPNHSSENLAATAIQEIERHFTYDGSPTSSPIGKVNSDDKSRSPRVPTRFASTSKFVAPSDEIIIEAVNPDNAKLPVLKRSKQNQVSGPSSLKWPIPEELISNIEPLQDVEVTRSWASHTLETIEKLSLADNMGDPDLVDVFSQLENQRRLLEGLTAQVSTVQANGPEMAEGELANQLQRLNFGLTRRLAVWRLVHQLSGQQDSILETEQSHEMILASRRTIPFNVHPEWEQYLLVEGAEAVFNSLNPSELEKKRTARKVLARLHSPALSPSQQQFVASAFEPQLSELLHVNATSTPDLHSLLKYLEKQETNESGLTQYKVNDQYQNLLWSKNDVARELASELNTHYRNANFRVSVSEEFVNRLIPQMPATAEPISERIMGAQVFGQNHIQNQIGVEFIPDNDQIQMRIVTRGEVRSNTRASKSGFTVDNQGTARFQVFKRLAFGRYGVSSDRPVAASSANQQLVGISSKLDPIPLLGWVARRIAAKKLVSEAPRAEQMVRKRVESTASERLQQEVETQLYQVRAYLNENLFQPLVAMDLEPDALEMSTSDDRVVMRYRLAGRDQMAANTARPRAINDCLLSMQIHQSAINNMLMRTDLGGRKFGTQELIEHLEQWLGISMAGADEIEHAAEFEFAHFDPLRVDFVNNEVEFTISLKSFKVGKKGKRWRNVQCTTTYVPQVQGRQIVLAQEKGGMQLQGKGLKLRDQIAIRGIFEALFKESYTIAPLPPQLIEKIDSPTLAIGQLVVDEGWIGVSIAEPQASNQPQQERVGRGFLRRRR